jgi:hypothetical protein
MRTTTGETFLALACALLCAGLWGCGGEEEAPTPDNPEAPVAVLSLPLRVSLGESVVLDGSGSSDDGWVEAWWFDPGDGSPLLQASSPRVVHTFLSPGRYTVSLSVLDNLGAKDTDRAEVLVEGLGGVP